MVEDFQENYGSGWIKMFRSIQKHWIWSSNKPLTKFEAWCVILFEANHSDAKISIGYDVFDCKRGESLNSLDTWAKLFNWDRSKVRRFFLMLKKDNMICFESVKKTTHLTVCNYANYQDVRNANETQVKRKRNTSEHKQEEKELKKKKNNKTNIEFDVFWDLYDKKLGNKKSCISKWNKLDDNTRQKIIDILPTWIKQFSDKQYQPFPATFFNQERWNDEIGFKPKPKSTVNGEQVYRVKYRHDIREHFHTESKIKAHEKMYQTECHEKWEVK